MDQKFKLEAILRPGKLSDTQKKEYAAKLQLPENDQQDLLYMSAILVSTGTNKNGATFMGSELIKARETINLKALDLEHEEDKIIGHIVSSMYFDQDGKVIDSEGLYSQIHEKANQENAEDFNKLISSLDSTEMDVGIVAVVYKDRFPELAEEIQNNEWKVSMECYYSDFDLKVGDKIVKKEALGKSLIGNSTEDLIKHLELVVGGNSLGTHMVSRVLREIKFCGCGIVKNPANERSLILEAAQQSVDKTLDRNNLIIDKEAATVNLAEDDIVDSPLEEDKHNTILQTESSGYVVAKQTESGFELVDNSFNFNYTAAQQEAIERTELSAQSGKNEKYFILAMNSMFNSVKSPEQLETAEGVLFKTNDIGRVQEIVDIGGKRESAARSVTRFNDNTDSAGLCVNFKKYVFERQYNVPQGRLLATHWCSLFNAPCPVLGANAQDKSCLRNKYARMTPIPYYNQWYTKPSAYNPNSPVPADEIEVLQAGDLPQPPSLQEAVESKLDYDNMEGLIGNPNTDSRDNPPIQTDNDVWEGSPSLNNTVPLDPEDIPSAPIENDENLIVLQNPYADFPVKVRSMPAAERAALEDYMFGLPSKRQYPLHTKYFVEGSMEYYSNLIKHISSYKERRELFVNIIKAADRFGIDTKHFEKIAPFKLKADKDFDEEYAIPRLKLLPLATKEQVLAAISRYSFLKVDNLSTEERARAHVNILRAASRFNINTENFRKRLERKDE